MREARRVTHDHTNAGAAFSPGVAGNSLYPGVKGLMLRFSQSLAAELAE